MGSSSPGATWREAPLQLPPCTLLSSSSFSLSDELL